MHFLNPNMLWGLAAISIPLIIHLFNFRKHRKIYFSNVKYIQELKVQTRRQSRLRHLLVLAARMLAIAALVLAFAQPYIPPPTGMASTRSANVVSIYLDNSFSMEAEGAEGELLARAGEKAREIAMSYRSSDLFQLLTNDFEGRHQRWLSREEFLDLLGEVTVSPASRPISQVIRRQDELFANAPSGNRLRFLISDFQVTTSDFDRIAPDSLASSFLVPLVAAKTANLYIDSCWFQSPVHQLGQSVRLMVRIRNASSDAMEKIPVKLSVNGAQKALASIDIPGESSALVEMPYTIHESGIQPAVLSINDYPVTFDDQLYLVYDVEPSMPVLTIYGDEEPFFLNTLLGHDTAFAYERVSYKSVNYDGLSSYPLIIVAGLPSISSGLGQALADYSANGGTLLVIPPVKGEMQSYGNFTAMLGVSGFGEMLGTQTQVTSLDLDNELFADVFEGGSLSGKKSDAPVDLPVVKRYYPLEQRPMAGRISLMKLLSGDDFLVMEKAKGGPVYLLAVALDDTYSNFQRHALFVPVIYRIALLSGATSPLYYTVGGGEVVRLKNAAFEGEEVARITGGDGKLEFIPGQRMQGSSADLLIYDQIRTAGHYQVYLSDSLAMGLAFNYNRQESDLRCFSSAELEQEVSQSGGQFSIVKDTRKPLADSIEELSQGRRFWKLFIILALIFLGTEILLLRLWAAR